MGYLEIRGGLTVALDQVADFRSPQGGMKALTVSPAIEPVT
jgi:hypothetical protein